MLRLFNIFGLKHCTKSVQFRDTYLAADFVIWIRSNTDLFDHKDSQILMKKITTSLTYF